jgi:hypothetical protein
MQPKYPASTNDVHLRHPLHTSQHMAHTSKPKTWSMPRELQAVISTLSWMVVSSMLIIYNKELYVLGFKYPLMVTGMGQVCRQTGGAARAACSQCNSVTSCHDRVSCALQAPFLSACALQRHHGSLETAQNLLYTASHRLRCSGRV